MEERKVTVQLPFMKDPVKYMMKKHQSNSNYGQALSAKRNPVSAIYLIRLETKKPRLESNYS